MLSVTAIVLIAIQFCLDAYTISHGSTTQYLDLLDIFGYYLFGLLGMILLIIDQFMLHTAIYKLRKKKKRKKQVIKQEEKQVDEY